MKLCKRLLVLSLAMLFTFTSCGGEDNSLLLSNNDSNSISLSNEESTSELIGEEISWEEAKVLLTNLNNEFQDKYDLDESIPEDLMYMYIDSSVSGYFEGEYLSQNGFNYFSMEEGNMFMVSNEGPNMTSYVIQDSINDTYISWKVKDNNVEDYKNEGLAGLGLAFGYVFLLMPIAPQYFIEQIDKENANPVSFIKYNDRDLDCTFENINEPEEGGEEPEYYKEVVTVKYRDGLGNVVSNKRYDQENKLIFEQNMKYSFGKKDIQKPIPPTVEE